MTIIVSELYDALKAAGVEDGLAHAAARAVIGGEERNQLATRGDVDNLRLVFKADMAELKADLIRWQVGTLIAMTAIFAGLIKLLH